MSHYLACELSDRIAAIASVTGSMLKTLPAGCKSSRPMPVLQFHGTSDEVVLYEGDELFLNIDSMMAFWAGFNGCQMFPDSSSIPDSIMTDSSTVTLIQFDSCHAESEVILYRINHGGHTWPGAFSLPNQITNQDIKASLLIWEFFQRHQHPNPRPVMTASINDEWVEMQVKEFKLYPNPAKDFIDLSLSFNKPKSLEITLFDLRGKALSKKKITDRIYDHRLSIPLNDLDEGVYLLSVRTERGEFVRRVIKN